MEQIPPFIRGLCSSGMHFPLEHLFKFVGLGSEETSVEVGFCLYKFAQMGGGRGSILGIEGGYFLFEGLKGLVIPFAACFCEGGPFFLNLTTCFVVLRMSVKEVTRSSTLGLVRLRWVSRR